MNNTELYFYCDIKKKEILDEAKPLDENWQTICGLKFLSEDELKDLSWAGYVGVGFLKLTNPTINQYAYSDKLLNNVRINLKNQLNDIKINKEFCGIIVNNSFNISLSTESKTDFIFKYLYYKDRVKEDVDIQLNTNSGIIYIPNQKFLKIFDFMQQYLNELELVKVNIDKKIDDMLTIMQLSKFDLNSVDWPKNAIEVP